MMHLKPYLRRTLKEQIEEYRAGIVLTEESLGVLEETDIGNAEYVVRFRSLWVDEGEKSTTTRHNGTLKGAIKKAEAEFKAANNRGDVQADCSVDICLGDNEYSIPQDYWRDFRESKISCR